MMLLLMPEYVEEVHEILCSLPFEPATSEDIEPPTQRHPGIEMLIDQLAQEMDGTEGEGR